MFHVTRCPNCRTSFRVTDAHLAAFDGKVRCGRCAFVFDAREQFVGENAPAPEPAQHAHADTPPAMQLAEPPAAHAAEPQAAPEPLPEEDGYGIDSITQQLDAAAQAEHDIHDTHDSLTTQSLHNLAQMLSQAPPPAPSHGSAMLELDLDTDGSRGEESRQQQPETPPAPVPEHPALAPSDHHDAQPTAPHIHDLHDEPVFAHHDDAYAHALAQEVHEEIVIEAPPEAEEDHAPGFEHWATQLALPPEPGLPKATAPAHEFVTDPEPVASDTHPEDAGAYRPILTAEDEALLRVPSRPSPWRWLWGIPCLLALLLLALQLVYHYRTELSVQVPGMRPRLVRFCELAGCRLDLPARAEWLHTEWSELKSAPDHPSLIQVEATLRNQAAFDQALPLMELTLTDDQDRVVAKKVFNARAYLAPLADGTPAPLPASLQANADLHAFLQVDLGNLHSSAYSINWVYAQPN